MLMHVCNADMCSAMQRSFMCVHVLVRVLLCVETRAIGWLAACLSCLSSSLLLRQYMQT